MSAEFSSSEKPKPSALITGGHGDLAREINRVLTEQNYQVSAPGKTELNVSSSDSIKAFFSQQSGFDLVICNAGIIRDKTALQLNAEEFQEVHSVCLDGSFRIARAALKSMCRKQSGQIIFIGSFSALSGPIGQANYAAAKAALIGFNASLAREYGQRGIRVNCVLPGFMETKMTAHLSADQRERLKQAHTLGRYNDAAAVARFIAFLDQHLPHTSGQVFNLDSRIHRWT